MRDGVAISGVEAANRSQRPVYNIYRARDGRHIAVTASSESSGRALFRYFDNEDLWQVGHNFEAPGAAAKEFLDRCFAQNDAQYWVDTLGALEIEIAMVQSPTEAFENEQLQCRNMILDTQDQAGLPLRQIGFPATASAIPKLIPAPTRYAHQPTKPKGR